LRPIISIQKNRYSINFTKAKSLLGLHPIKFIFIQLKLDKVRAKGGEEQIMAIIKYIVRRIISAFFTWIIALSILFVLPRLLPVSPEELLASSYRLPEEATRIMREKFGLELPLTSQFVLFLKNVVFNFPPDFGFSYTYYPSRVWDIMTMYLGWTIFLLLLSLIMTVVIGTFLGILMAWRRGSKIEKILSCFTVFAMSSPVFWLGYLLIIVFSMTLQIFPAGGAHSPTLAPSFSFEFIINAFRYAALPMLTLVITQSPSYAVLLRDNMLYIFWEDYVLMAEAKGVKEKDIVLKHVARNAILPVITLFMMQAGLILGGQIMVEIIFSYPGVGRLIVDAILGLDYPVIIGFFYLIISMGITMNLVADLIYPFIDPRVRFE